MTVQLILCSACERHTRLAPVCDHCGCEVARPKPPAMQLGGVGAAILAGLMSLGCQSAPESYAQNPPMTQFAPPPPGHPADAGVVKPAPPPEPVPVPLYGIPPRDIEPPAKKIDEAPAPKR